MKTQKTKKVKVGTTGLPPNAFIGKSNQPTREDLASVLGPATALWEELISNLQEKTQIDSHEWASYSPKAGWSLRLKRKDRIIVYMIPLQGCFQVALVLGDKAVKATRDAKLPVSVNKIIAEARRYAEGTGIRILVNRPEDIPAIRKLAAIKLES